MKKQVIRFGPFKDFIADGVKIGNTIYLSGVVSINEKGEVVGADDYPAQIRQSYANIKVVLGKFGATMNDIVDEMWLVTDMESTMGSIGDLFAVRAECYGGTPAVSQTMVQVAGLVMPELMIEIKCVAMVD